MAYLAYLRTLWKTCFGALLAGCFYFMTYKFNIMGHQMSVVNVIVFTECFDLIMTKIGQMFGKTETESD